MRSKVIHKGFGESHKGAYVIGELPSQAKVVWRGSLLLGLESSTEGGVPG
jgi:hypothetical protein